MDGLERLRGVVEDIVGDRAGVEVKKMFGCDGFFKNGTIFALIWKEGRIGVKVRDEATFEELRAVKGSDPWSPSKVAMKRWVLVPPGWNKGGAALGKALASAYEQCALEAAKPKAKATKPKAKATKPKAKATKPKAKAAKPKAKAAKPKAKATKPKAK